MWRGDEKEPETRGGEKIRRSVKNVVVLSHDKIWIGAKVASYAMRRNSLARSVRDDDGWVPLRREERTREEREEMVVVTRNANYQTNSLYYTLFRFYPILLSNHTNTLAYSYHVQAGLHHNLISHRAW